MTIIALSAIAIAILMIGQWAGSIARDAVPELRTRPAEIRLHLLAEFATAGTLLVGGGLALAGLSVATAVLLFGFGMLTYTAIVSPGYFLDRGERGPVAMFGAIVLVAVLAAGYLAVDLLI